MLNKCCWVNSLSILPQTEEAGDEGVTIIESGRKANTDKGRKMDLVLYLEQSA